VAGRSKNQIETVQMVLSTTPGVIQHLQDLVATSLYGKHYTEAAERLLSRALEEMVKDGRLKARSSRGRR
jgi:hypothetical protein